MTTSLFSIISYVLISSFTPGPSNISSASLAVLHGYKKTLKLSGRAGFRSLSSLMIVSGWFSKALLNIFPALEPIMRYVGAAYILYLAFGILKASYSFTEENTKPLRLSNGFMLQILNPKLTIYSFTLFSAFLTVTSTNLMRLIFTAAILAATSFCATSIWALFGTTIQKHLHRPRTRMIVNIILSLSLVYTAIALTGLV